MKQVGTPLSYHSQLLAIIRDYQRHRTLYQHQWLDLAKLPLYFKQDCLPVGTNHIITQLIEVDIRKIEFGYE